MNKVRVNWTIVIVVLVLLNSCAARLHVTADGKQFYVETAYNFNWLEALSKCTQMNMTLISMDSSNKNLELNNLITTNYGTDENYFWIGGHDHNVSRLFEWISTGEAFDYTNWYSDQPSDAEEHCVFMYTGQTLQWHDYNCTDKNGFVCEEIPLQKMTNAELLLLQASAENQTNLLKEKTEELDSLKKEFEMLKNTQTNLMLEFDKIKNLSEQSMEEIKQNQKEIGILKQSSEQQMTQIIGTGNTKSPMNPMYCTTQAALLKAKSEELQVSQKNSELIIAQLFGALQKSLELHTNRTTPNKNYNIFPNLNKN